MMNYAVMIGRILSITAFFLLFIYLFIIPVSADAGGYIVKPVPSGLNPEHLRELPLVPLCEQPFRALAINLTLFLSPLLIYPIEVFFSLKLFAWLGFRKIAKKNVLANSARSAIFHYIRETPGTDFSEISRETGITQNSLRYHLAVLRLMNKITLLETSRNARYFENSDAYPVREQMILKYLHNRPTRALLNLVKEDPNRTRSDLATAIGISGAGVNWHMQRLSDDGIIAIRREGKNTRYEINDDIIPYLEKYHSLYTDENADTMK